MCHVEGIRKVKSKRDTPGTSYSALVGLKLLGEEKGERKSHGRLGSYT